MSRSCYSAAERQVVEEYPKAAKPQPDRRVTIHRIKRALPEQRPWHCRHQSRLLYGRSVY